MQDTTLSPLLTSRKLALFASAAALAFAPAAMAQEADASQDAAEDIVVTAHSIAEINLMAGSVELKDDALLRAMSPQIGEALASLPGVSTTAFAPGASRPVLRGLAGDRVRVLIDGIGSLDASSVSADHGVALDTLTIDHVDVLHGPAALAYGGQAIGGAVNAYDKRIPRKVPDAPLALTAIASFDSVSDGKSAAGSIDLPLAPRLAFHVDASWHDANDQRVGGNVVSPALRAELAGRAAGLIAEGAADEAAALLDAASATGRLANSFSRGTSFGAGLAFIDAGGSLGISVQRSDGTYGIPARPGGEEGVAIDMGQTRVDFRGQLVLSGFFDTLNLRAAHADYSHSELEDGEVGTTFDRNGIEARIELVQANNGGWTGTSGIHYAAGSLAVTGEEAILPASKDTQFGLFTLQSVAIGQFDIEAAGRIERATVRAASLGFDRAFTLHSGAVGLAWRPFEGLKLGVNLAHSERAPSPEELLTDGLHVATQAYEIGDPAFGKESGDGIEAYVRYDGDGTRLSLTGYLTDFDNFITPVPNGAEAEGVPVFAYRQLSARFQGIEAQAWQKLASLGGGTLAAEAALDYVHAELKGAGPVPRIPPLRLMGALDFDSDTLGLRAEVEWNAAQDRVGPFEYPTQAFALVGASATWRPMGKDGMLTLLLSGDNLLNATGRRAASFTRDFVPVAGRNVRLTAKLAF